METDRLKTEASQSRISQALDESFNLLSLGKLLIMTVKIVDLNFSVVLFTLKFAWVKGGWVKVPPLFFCQVTTIYNIPDFFSLDFCDL